MKTSDIGQGIFIEMFGMLFDVLLLVLLYNFINARGEKENAIKKYNDEIDDFRGWRSEEAKYRIKGSIIRLNRLKQTKFNLSLIDLSCLDLPEESMYSSSNLFKTDFTNTKLKKADFSDIICSNSKFNSSFLLEANFNNALMQYTDFSNAFLHGSNFSNSKLSNISFAKANLIGVNFQNTYFTEINFDGAEVSSDFMAKLANWETNGDSIGDKYNVITIPQIEYPGHFCYVLQRKR